MEEPRSTDGRFTPEHTDGELLAAVRAHEPAATSEVADEVGMTRQGADRRLRRLRDAGRVNSKKIGASRVWFTGDAPEPTERPDPDEWEEKRREVLARDEYTCLECGADVSKTGSEIHHTKPLAAGGDNTLSNLETLCPNCHGEKHQEPLENVLDVFNQVRGPAIISADVADRLDCSRETARRKLETLHDRGDLARRKVSRRVIYWRPESGRERRETPADTDAVQTPPSTPNAESEDTRPEDTDDDLGAVVDAVAEGWDDTDDRLAARKDAARAVLKYAREHGTVSKQEAEEEVYPAHQVDGQTPDTWYRQNVRPVLNEAAEYDPSARAYRLVEDVHP